MISKEDILNEPLEVSDRFKMAAIRKTFPAENEETLLKIYHLDLENIHSHGAQMGTPRVCDILKVINQVGKEFPELMDTETMLKPEYVISCYTLMATLHNLHKVSSDFVYTYGFNHLYAVIINNNVPFKRPEYSILRVTDDEIEMVSRNALALCVKLNSVATENDYLEIILALHESFTIEEQWMLFSKLHYSQIVDMIGLPFVYIDKLLD